MTAYCRVTTSHSRPTSFWLPLPEQAPHAQAQPGREERAPQQPVPPTYSVDTPDDEPVDASDASELDPPLLRPNKKRVPDEEHGAF